MKFNVVGVVVVGILCFFSSTNTHSEHNIQIYGIKVLVFSHCSELHKELSTVLLYLKRLLCRNIFKVFIESAYTSE